MAENSNDDRDAKERADLFENQHVKIEDLRAKLDKVQVHRPLLDAKRIVGELRYDEGNDPEPEMNRAAKPWFMTTEHVSLEADLRSENAELTAKLDRLRSVIADGSK